MRTSYSSLEIIVVDNASTDGSPETVAQQFPGVKLIRLLRNTGYAAANNIGIRAATGEYLVLLNSDTEVEPPWLEFLVNAAERARDTAFLQPKILFLDNRSTINSAGNNIHFAGFGVCRGIGERDVGQYDQIQVVGYASGACVMASRKVLESVGLLDEIFFAYGEDKDWGWRAKMLGLQSMYVPGARVYHKWSAVLGRSPRKMYYLELERLVSICKNHTKRMLVLLAPILIIVELAVLTHAIARGWLPNKIKAYAHAFNLRKEIRKRRRELLPKIANPESALLMEFVYALQHPYVGRVAVPLNQICSLYKRLLITQ
jgi:GT2 family glycosyltransferase